MPNPVFILTSARSGSTLLSSIVGGHEAFVNVGETNFVNVALAAQGSQLYVDQVHPDLWDTRDRPLRHVHQLRSMGESLFAEAAGTAELLVRPCDKSLPNIHGAAVLASVWPEAKFVCLYRHCADFIHSSLAAAPFGVAGYGFDPFVARSPSNMVLAFAHYWLERVKIQRSFSSGVYASNCTSVRYEDIVVDSNEALAPVWALLEVSPEVDAGRFFQNHLPGRTFRDHKISFTDTIHDASLGRGVRIPVSELLPATLIAAINAELKDLGYTTIGPDWGAGGDGGVASVLANNSTSLPRSWLTTPEESTCERDGIVLLLTEGGEVAFERVIDIASGKVVEDVGHHKRIGILILPVSTLVGIATGFEDYGDAYRRGEVRYFAVGSSGAIRRVDQGEPIVDEVGDAIIETSYTLTNEMGFNVERGLSDCRMLLASHEPVALAVTP